MKKVLLGAIVAIFCATSCSTRNQSQPVATKYDLKGMWQITNVNYDQNYKVKPFDEGVDIKCFVGSQWNLVPNNGKGSYNINGADCPAISRNIRFDVSKDKQFSFKVIPDGTKAKNTTAGYFLQLYNQTPTSFDLQQNVSDGTQPIQVVYHFEKVN